MGGWAGERTGAALSETQRYKPCLLMRKAPASLDGTRLEWRSLPSAFTLF